MNTVLFINKKLICFEFIVRLLFSIIFFWFCFFSINNIFNKLDMLSINNLNCIFLSRYQTGQLKEYIYPGNSIEVLTSPDSRVPVRSEIFMQTQLRNGFEDIILSEKEVAISRNISSLINMEAGDFLYIDTGYKEIDRYVISHIFDPSYGNFHDPLSDWGLIILGYDKNYENSINTKYICFSYNSLSDLDPAVINSIDNARDIIIIKDFKFNVLYFIFLGLLLFISIALFIFWIIRKIFGDYWNRYFILLSRLGYSGRYIISVILIFSALLILLPFLIGYIINIIINNSIDMNFKAFCLVSIIFASLSLAWCIYCYRICIINKRFKNG